MKYTILILLILSSITIYGQKNFESNHIKFSIGLGVNTVKDKINTNSIWGDPNIQMETAFGAGYNFFSEFDIPITKNLSFNSGIYVTLYYHLSKGSYANDTLKVFNNEKFKSYQPAIEIPLMLSYKFLKHNNNYLTTSLGVKYTSYIYYSSGYGIGSSSGYHYKAFSSPDQNIGDGNAWKAMNVSSIIRLSYFMMLNNKDYLNFHITHNAFALRPVISEYVLTDPDGFVLGGGEINGYYSSFTLGISYTFSFQRSIDKAYNKGYEEGLKIN